MEPASFRSSNLASGAMNPDLAKERQGSTFDTLQMMYFLYDSPQRLRRQRYVQNLALTDPKFQGVPSTYLGRNDAYNQVMEKSIHFYKRLKQLNLENIMDIRFFREAAMPNEPTPFTLHTGMFLHMLSTQCNEEQLKTWLPRTENFAIIGTYAQTELGHGTFLRGLETTSTYDPKTEEFVIHSPTLTSMKWWPGALGKTSSVCIVMAQLYTRGNHCGMYPFIVQLRHMDNHQPMPGVTVGDIGPKFGFSTNDNGFLRLDHVRVPRMNMLMKNAVVERDGTFRKLASDRLTYGTMVRVRAYIAMNMSRSMAAGCTIATRYSAVRRQSEIKPGEPEVQVLDFQTQQYKLFPLIATAYAFHMVAQDITSMYNRITTDMSQGNLKELPQLHAASAGLKAYMTWVTAEGLEMCRLACGGHGYSQASGFPKIYLDTVAACTYEGENTVLALQTARFLMKCCTQIQAGETLPGFVSYLSLNPNRKSSLTTALDVKSLLDVFEYRAARSTLEAARKMGQLMANGRTREEAWNMTSVDLVRAAMSHCEAYIVSVFVENVARPDLDLRVKSVLTTLCQFYCCHGICANMGDYLLDSYFNEGQAELVREAEVNLMSEIRPNAVALVDAFDFPDRVLDSCLGRYDGRVYEAMYEYAKNSPFNQSEVHESYYKYLRPLIQEGKVLSKL